MPGFSAVEVLFYFPFVTRKYFVEEVLGNYTNIPFPIELPPTGLSIYS